MAVVSGDGVFSHVFGVDAVPATRGHVPDAHAATLRDPAGSNVRSFGFSE